MGLLLYVPMLFVVRLFVVWLLRRQMGQVSETAPADAPAAGAETPARSRLRFERLERGSLSPEVEAARNAAVARSRRLFRIALALDVIAGVAYGFAFDSIDKSAFGSNDDVQLILGLVCLLGLPILALVRYAIHRRQYWGDRGALRENSSPPIWAARKLTDPRWQPLLRYLLPFSAAVIVVKFRPSLPSVLVLALLVALHVTVMLWFDRAIQRNPGLSLLLLRVFGVRKSSALTLDALLDRWRHFGCYLTVMDPELLRLRTPIVTFGNYFLHFPVLALLLFADEWGPIALVMLPSLLVVGWSMYRLIARQSVHNVEQLRQMLDLNRRRPRRTDITFRGLEVSCFDNTWRPAVAEAAGRADVVLMDLRGYTPDREGCRTEVNFLFDTLPLDRLLFLMEPGDEAAIKQLLTDAWRSLARTSPNLGLTQPVAKLLVTRSIEGLIARAKDAFTSDSANDVQHLLDQLIAIAAPPVKAA
jgi:hypothetical protein